MMINTTYCQLMVIFVGLYYVIFQLMVTNVGKTITS